MAKIQYTHDITSSEQFVQGSSGRLNVSSRGDSRSYYNSRDDQLAFSLVWSDASTATSDFIVYWKNTDTTGKHLVIDSAGINSQYRADFQLHAVTGTAAGGSVATPACLNRAAPKVAQATCRSAVSSAITGLSSVVIIDHATVPAGGHEEFRLDDRLRIGQDQALAIQCVLTDTSPGLTHGVIFGFYE